LAIRRESVTATTGGRQKKTGKRSMTTKEIENKTRANCPKPNSKYKRMHRRTYIEVWRLGASNSDFRYFSVEETLTPIKPPNLLLEYR
jgi:hypothetical protein